MKEYTPHSSLANEQDKNMNISSGRKIKISTNLDIEVDNIPFHLIANGDSVVISFDKFSDALSLFTKTKSLPFSRVAFVHKIKQQLELMGMTVYLQNHHFGLAGPKAGIFFPRLFELLFALRR